MALAKQFYIGKFKKIKNWIKSPRIGVAISGGGCKAFYGMGLFSQLSDYGLRVNVWGGTSAGASMAVALAARKVPEVLSTFLALTSVNEKNLYLSRIISGRTPFPHEPMYRSTIRQNLDWEVFQARVEDIAILVAKVPDDKMLKIHENVKVFYDLTRAYRHDAELRQQGKKEKFLIAEARKLGLEEFVFRKKDIRDKKHLEDIILASSSVPPLVSFQKIDNQRYLDGGIFANMPIKHLGKVDYRLGVVYEKQDLINYSEFIQDKRTVIFYPDKKVNIAIWEYSRPDLIEEVYMQGRKDAEKAADLIDDLI